MQPGGGRVQSSYQVSGTSFAIAFVCKVNLGGGYRFSLCPIVRVHQQERVLQLGSTSSGAGYRGVLCAWQFAGAG